MSKDCVPPTQPPAYEPSVATAPQGYGPPQQGYGPPQQGYAPPQQGYGPGQNPSYAYPPPVMMPQQPMQQPVCTNVVVQQPTSHSTVIVKQKGYVNHWLHFWITLFFFPWIFVWICLCICNCF